MTGGMWFALVVLLIWIAAGGIAIIASMEAHDDRRDP